MKAWIDGRLVEGESAYVSAFDHGFTVGDGVFETMRMAGSAPFALTRHLRRLARSATALGLDLPGEDVLRAAVLETVAASDPDDLGRVRITATSGPGPLGSGRGDATPTVVVMVSPARAWPATTTLVTVPWPRNEHSAVAGLKTTSYAENVIALAWAHERGASEALLLNTAGYVCEGTGSNVFAVLGERVVTPPLTSGCLAGVTRELVLEWCGGVEGDLTVAELAGADEVFVTSSTRDVHPVERVDELKYDAPGPVTARIAAEFARRAALDADPV